MSKTTNTIYNTTVSKRKISLADWILHLLSVLLLLPLFMLFHSFIPNVHLPYHLDEILLFLFLWMIIELLLLSLKPFVLGALVAVFIFLTYGSIKKTYGFESLVNDYRAVVYAMLYEVDKENVLFSKFPIFPNTTKITHAVDFNHPDVRQFALQATLDNFQSVQKNHQYRMLIQSFAVFKKINTNWNYVSDPKSNEYYAKASASTKLLSGDCDDHAILMAACIKAIGGKTRLIRTKGHLYPELFIGNQYDMDNINYLIRQELFKDEIKNDPIKSHTDNNNDYWINMDYTKNYPGGPFLSPEVYGVLNLF